jgi:hypothetical protein
MLLSIMQQTQPALSMVAMQSQQDWIISAQALSPLVHMTDIPLSDISHLHMPMVRLQQHTTEPFMTMQQLHMLPVMAEQSCCIMLAAIGSSHMQVIFMPPVHFSILNVQRGTIIQFMDSGMEPGMVGVGMPWPLIPGIGIPIRSIICTLLTMLKLLFARFP